MSSGTQPIQPDQLHAVRESVKLAAELADALEAQADRVRRQCRQIEEVLAAVDVDGMEEAPGAAEPLSLPSGTEIPGGVGPARLAAVAMAMQGRPRGDVEAYLEALGMEDVAAEEILDGLRFQEES